MRSCTGRAGPARRSGNSPPSPTPSIRRSWTAYATAPLPCSTTPTPPRAANQQVILRNSIGGARHSCGQPAGYIGETMSLPKPDNQTTVVITGASSGIGAELARGLGRRGFPLLLVARRRDRLDELANEVGKEYSIAVEVMPLDLSDG